MTLEFRHARESDLPRILEIYSGARAFMAESGNPDQWTNGYPDEAAVREDLRKQQLFVCSEQGCVVGVFCYFHGEEPDYREIFEGSWPNDQPYGVVHRIACGIRGKGIASACLDFTFRLCGNLRIDTHRNNVPMQRTLEKNGFRRCGIIYLRKNGDQRIAYQKI